jgi:hypothetical protein
VFAKVRAGKMTFAGKVGDARNTIDNTLKGNSALVKYPLALDQLENWRHLIEQLARDFLAGRADVNPIDPLKTCERCGLQVLCRIAERPLAIDEEDEAEAVDE